MSTASQSTIDDVAERVRTLLDEARAALPDEARGSGESDLADALSDSGRTTLRALGSDAVALLEDTEPAALLAALDIDRPHDADSIPAAILAGDSDDVASLRAILTLSRLADGEDAEASFDEEERDAMATLAPLLPDESASKTATDETATEPDRADAETQSRESDTGDDAGGDEISAVLREALDDVRTDLDEVLGIGGGGKPSDEGSDTEESDDETGDAGGSIGGGASDRTRQSVSGLGRATYSTMPAQDRPDMSGVPRYRTLADR